MKHIVLCADDYGQNSYISQAIIELIKENRLSATSCMTTSPHWKQHATWLEPYNGTIDIGLHFNLTEGSPLSQEFSNRNRQGFEPLNSLILKAHLRKIDKTSIESELHAQLDQFVAGIGQLPDFIDGHQHVHQLPVIREALFLVYEKRLRQSGCYIRCVHSPLALWQIKANAYFKMLVIQLCGSFALKKALIKRKIPHNVSFSGVYDFNVEYAEIFPKFLEEIRDNGIIMCHPGLINTVEPDSISRSRYREYQYFKSPQFIDMCLGKGTQLSRFR